MTHLYLIRHGEPETAWGEGVDPGLSEAGRAQADAAAAALAGFGRLAILSSPMRRCLETATPFAHRIQAPVLIEPGVSEVATPASCDDRRAWLRENFPWPAGAADMTWRQLDPRLGAWRADVLAAVCAVAEDCAVFTHFIAINVIVGAALTREHTIVCRPGYASITQLALDRGALRLVRMGAELDQGVIG